MRWAPPTPASSSANHPQRYCADSGQCQLGLAGVVILESALSFLGVGVQEPTPSWGNMLATAQSYMFQHPWLPLVPGIPLCLVAIAFNFIGDGLRDALDPRLKR